jgi:hypothetical protein
MYFLALAAFQRTISIDAALVERKAHDQTRLTENCHRRICRLRYNGQVGGASMAVIDKEDGGIQFGPEGLTIPLGSTGKHPKLAKSRLGSYYAKLPDGGRHLFSDNEAGKGTELTDLKVWVAKGRGEEWELNGIVWSTSARN